MAETTTSTWGSAAICCRASSPTKSLVGSPSRSQSCWAAACGSVAAIQAGRNVWACSSSSVRFRRAAKATARNVPPEAAITSRALRPMLPVEPRTAMLVTRSVIRPGGVELSDARRGGRPDPPSRLNRNHMPKGLLANDFRAGHHRRPRRLGQTASSCFLRRDVIVKLPIKSDNRVIPQDGWKRLLLSLPRFPVGCGIPTKKPTKLTSPCDNTFGQSIIERYSDPLERN